MGLAGRSDGVLLRCLPTLQQPKLRHPVHVLCLYIVHEAPRVWLLFSFAVSGCWSILPGCTYCALIKSSSPSPFPVAIMGVISLTRARKDVRVVQDITGSDLHGLKYEVNVSADSNGSDGDHEVEQKTSVETVPEKPPQRNSHRTTQGAYIGVQKAEAAALAWSKKSAYGTFAL